MFSCFLASFTTNMSVYSTKNVLARGQGLFALAPPQKWAELTCPGLAPDLPPAGRSTLVRSFRLPPQLASRFQPVRIPTPKMK